MRPIRLPAALAALLGTLALAPAACAASGVVASGRGDGGAFRYAIAAPGWQRVQGSAGPYGFRLARAGVTIDVARAPRLESAAGLARAFAARAAGRRAIVVDADHAEVVGSDGRPLAAFADASGPFDVAFTARTRAGAGAGLVRAIAHGARFRWAGPDVEHPRVTPETLNLIAAANLAMTFEDSYRDSVSVDDRPSYEVERVRSRRYELTTYHAPAGIDHQLFVDGRSFDRPDGRPCWSHSRNRPGDDAFAPISVPPPGYRLGYGPPRQVGSALTVEQTLWNDDASSLRTTLSFDPATHLLLRRRSTVAEEVFSWVPITVQPVPNVICRGTGPAREESNRA